MKVDIIGGGLAGVEAASILSSNGVKVTIWEMRPKKMTGIHKTGDLAEIVCSNSLKSMDPLTSKGLLKAEMRRLNSFVLKIAAETRVPAGRSLNVVREKFSRMITEELSNDPNIKIKREEVLDLAAFENIIIATGPLTSPSFSSFIQTLTGADSLYFYDAVSPVIRTDTIDMSQTFWGLRYGKGEGKLLNFPMDEAQYSAFYDELINAGTVPLNDVDEKLFFEACLPVEEIASRGKDSLCFGPLRPVGFRDYIEKRPHAVVQARPENNLYDAVELIGFQTRLKFEEQKRVLRMIPGLQSAKFLRYGIMHRNTYINSPGILQNGIKLIDSGKKRIFFAGQLTGVEGYIESAASGIIAGLAMLQDLQKGEFIIPGENTMTGALLRYLSSPPGKSGFKPMSANFGLLDGSAYSKKTRRKRQFERSMGEIGEYTAEISKFTHSGFKFPRMDDIIT
ncbi:methylenetetrahydrofolate--tRNA-(uracil(54)-C(5))-methyltransferase (FADH(2)-oxidizing) TrmFO [bacterium]|nr:methylenetetrahydrofolate--tRNA-(uracil(54)-C(5))-methyltransferase (FADH(2)-oxidizing) TrmFO [bacterium]